jgi:galactose mutarotase-like enzyme
MSSCRQCLSQDGLTQVSMQNPHVSLTILADAGGKIAEFVNRRSGHDWLWQNPHITVKAAQYDVDYGSELDSGGWDEVLLSMSPSDLTLGDGKRRHIPDHGDVVGQRWSVIDASVSGDGRAICEMAVTGRAVDYRLSRTIELGPDSTEIDVRYALTNKESFNLPWYWSMHALLNAQHELEIELPKNQELRLDHAEHGINGEPGMTNGWPYLPSADGSARDLSRCFGPDSAAAPFAGKFFVRSPDSGLVKVVVKDTRECLAIRYDPAQLPWIGLWVNNRGWSGCGSDPYTNLGIEPSTAAFDNVSSAVDDGSIAWLRPGETREWWLSVGFIQ